MGQLEETLVVIEAGEDPELQEVSCCLCSFTFI